MKDKTQIEESQSSDDEYGYVNSEEIEDSDLDFIDHDTIAGQLLSDEETELYHLDLTHTDRAPFKRKKSAVSSSESESDTEVCSPPSTLAAKLSGKLRKHSMPNKENEVPSKSKRLNAAFQSSRTVMTRKKKGTNFKLTYSSYRKNRRFLKKTHVVRNFSTKLIKTDPYPFSSTFSP